MRRLLYLVSFTFLSLTACEEEVIPVGVDLRVYMAGPLSAATEENLPPKFSDLLRPLRCEDKLSYLDVELTIVRIDHDPVVSETIILPLNWVDKWRKDSDTYTFANHLDSYEGNAAEISYPDIFKLEPGGSKKFPETIDGELFFCCEPIEYTEERSANELPLEKLPQYLTELSCEEDLQGRYAISYFLTNAGGASAPTQFVTNSAPAVSPSPLLDRESTIIAALNQTGDPDIDPDTRFERIENHLALFTSNAHVKVYGDNGTIVDNQPIEDYLETLSSYLTIDTIHVDQALMKDSLCWELRVREIHQ